MSETHSRPVPCCAFRASFGPGLTTEGNLLRICECDAKPAGARSPAVSGLCESDEQPDPPNGKIDRIPDPCSNESIGNILGFPVAELTRAATLRTVRRPPPLTLPLPRKDSVGPHPSCMFRSMRSCILGIGTALPSTCLTTSDVESLVLALSPEGLSGFEIVRSKFVARTCGVDQKWSAISPQVR